MSLKFEWRDKQDGVDDILSEDINSIAHSVIENEEKILELDSKTAEHGEKIESNELEILGLKEKDEDIFEKISSKIEFVDVDVLPTENIQEGCIYRIRKAHGVYYLKDDSDVTPLEATAKCTIHYVDTLPEVGIRNQISGSWETAIFHFYKKKGDNEWFYYQSDVGNWYGNPYAIFESIEEAKNNRHGFVPERTECELYVADKPDPFNVRWVHLNKKAISNVTTLPMDDIDEEGFYKTSENFASTYVKYEDGSIEADSLSGIPITFHVVDELPTQGESAVSNAESTTTGFIGYYCRSDKMAYAFWDIGNGEFSWIPLQDFLVYINPNATWKEIQSVDEVTDIDVLYIRLNKNAIFHYDGEWHELVDKAALDGKLDKVTKSSSGMWELYAIKADGTQTMQRLDSSPTPYTIANRGAGGAVGVGTPTGETHAVNLGYANEHYVQITPNNSGIMQALVQNTDGTIAKVGINTSATDYTVARRYTDGRLKVASPVLAEDATPRKYVDNAVARGAMRTFIDWKTEIESQYWFDVENLVGYRGTYAFGSGRYDVHLTGDSDSVRAVGTFTPDEVSGVKVTGDTDAVGVYVCDDEVDFYGKYIMYFFTDGNTGEHFLLDIDILDNVNSPPWVHIHVTHIVFNPQ